MDHQFDIRIGTDIGGRVENQDFAAKKETKLGSLIIVCDGMGGTKGGAIASELAVDVILKYFEKVTGSEEPLEVLRMAITQANKVIFDKGMANNDLRGMGTTVAVLLLRPEQKKYYVSHVGDSRVYQIRSGRLRFRTKDHSVVQGKVDRGEIKDKDARFDPNANQITKALGVRDIVEIDQNVFDYLPGDVFLLTSDGIHGEIDESELLKIVKSYKASIQITETIKNHCMVEGAKSKGGKHDNLTIATIVAVPVSWSTNPRNKIRFVVGVILLLVLFAFAAYQFYPTENLDEDSSTVRSTYDQLSKRLVKICTLLKQMKGLKPKDPSQSLNIKNSIDNHITTDLNNPLIINRFNVDIINCTFIVGDTLKSKNPSDLNGIIEVIEKLEEDTKNLNNLITQANDH